MILQEIINCLQQTVFSSFCMTCPYSFLFRHVKPEHSSIYQVPCSLKTLAIILHRHQLPWTFKAQFCLLQVSRCSYILICHWKKHKDFTTQFRLGDEGSKSVGYIMIPMLFCFISFLCYINLYLCIVLAHCKRQFLLLSRFRLGHPLPGPWFTIPHLLVSYLTFIP